MKLSQMPIFNLPVSTYSNLFGGIFEKRATIIPPLSHTLFTIEHSLRLDQDLTSARVVPNKFRLFCVYLAEGCRLDGGEEGRGGGRARKENYKSFDEACCVLKKKGHRGSMGLVVVVHRVAKSNYP